MTARDTHAIISHHVVLLLIFKEPDNVIDNASQACVFGVVWPSGRLRLGNVNSTCTCRPCAICQRSTTCKTQNFTSRSPSEQLFGQLAPGQGTIPGTRVRHSLIINYLFTTSVLPRFPRPAWLIQSPTLCIIPGSTSPRNLRQRPVR
jgi:hypothetical protein